MVGRSETRQTHSHFGGGWRRRVTAERRGGCPRGKGGGETVGGRWVGGAEARAVGEGLGQGVGGGGGGGGRGGGLAG